jgi:hypothetical protein
MPTHPHHPDEQPMSILAPARSSSRRVFFLKILAANVLLGTTARPAIAAEKLNPADPYARSMGYRLNTEEVDQVKYPRHTVEQHCQACQLWNGGDKEFGNCSFFDGAITPKNGWCKNFKVKKAAAA